MKRSIRVRFTCLFFAVIALVVATALCANNFGLESFYKKQKVKDLQTVYSVIDRVVMQEGNQSERLTDILNYSSSQLNITIAVMDSANSSVICTSERGTDSLFRHIQKYLFNSVYREQATELLDTDNYRIISAYDEHTDSTNIECIGYCGDNQTILLMSTPVANLKESVRLSNLFLGYVGIFAMLLGVFLVFFMTRQITKPIQRLAALSQRMGELDFNERYVGKYEDEIGVLGNNMNFMAGKLEETIEELKKANAELQEDIRRKEEIDEMRKAFIANVSHELKTPIALIQGYAEGLNDGLCEDPESRKYYLDVIIDEAERMNKLVQQLLLLSRLESGNQPLEAETFDLGELIRGIAGNTKLMAEEKQAEVVLSLPEDDAGKPLPIPVTADEFKIEEVLTNYISNAAHHVNEGGTIRISAEESGDRIRIHVFNTGSRIPEEDLPHIWDKFYKVDKAHSRAYGGSGIGLSIVKAIMDAHGMPYGVSSTEEGVDFWFELPSEKT